MGTSGYSGYSFAWFYEVVSEYRVEGFRRFRVL